MNTKIANSAYGAMGNAGFIFYDPRMATAVTVTGRYIIQYVSSHLNKRFNEFFKTTNRDYLTYIDTDSFFMVLDNVVKKYFASHTTEQIVSALDKLASTKLIEFVEEATDHIAKVQNVYEQTIYFKREKIISSGFWCVHPDTNVVTTEGEICIAELFDSFGKGGGDVRNIDSIDLFSVSNAGYQEIDSITHVMRKWYSGEMYTITTPDGSQIRVTADHKVMVIRNCVRMWVMAKEVLTDDTLVLLNR